ncbi:sugar phosphate isomerase/epimerase family protein [Actinomadura rudentiformis]|uniref:Sugar phosphate isomerase/epimerase n=1 Tax=Actinomadura rudentiformis TaxID=359158 RepID=A0A6H9YRE5_9ACTN|nr:sugar phosphate isomerase/epimerase family protein [Actinomadura rudentiformis]KAB2347891.1 sugar phosphate isomerase/epimerase [Actinomadura rudentiformis]
MTEPFTDRLSINQITVKSWTFEETVRGCARHGIGHVGAWLDSVAEIGVDKAAGVLADHGVSVSSVCRAGFFTGNSPDRSWAGRADNERAIDMTARLGADVLYLVCGGVADDRDLPAARAAVRDGLAELVPYAAERGVRLAVEPLHPMMCAERSVIVTLDQAVELAEPFGPDEVGIAIDTYNVWWDPRLAEGIERAGDRIIGYQVCDWLVPQPHPVFGRGVPGEGVIDLRGITRAVDATGYDGPIEVEIFNEKVWSSPPDEVIRVIKERFAAGVLG